MLYCDTNFKTKKAMKEAVAAGKQVTVYQPGGMFPSPTEGVHSVGGPHYPKPHKWYARIQIEGGVITKVLG